MDGITIRRAEAADKREVLSFCVGTFDWGDYIDEVFDEWLSDPDSLFLVAEADGKPVGIVNARLMSHGVAWLEGLRVKKEVRRLGVGRALTDRAEEMLAETGRRTLRLLVESNNVASMSLASAEGFKEEATWTFYHGKKPLPRVSKGARRVTTATAPKVWRLLDSSDRFNEACRSYELDWAVHPLEADDFSDLVRKRMIIVAGDGKTQAVGVLKVGGKDRKWARACFLLGDTAEVKQLANFAISEAAKTGAKRLNVSCPNQASTVEGLRASGFVPGFRTSIVYVKRT